MESESSLENKLDLSVLNNVKANNGGIFKFYDSKNKNFLLQIVYNGNILKYYNPNNLESDNALKPFNDYILSLMQFLYNMKIVSKNTSISYNCSDGSRLRFNLSILFNNESKIDVIYFETKYKNFLNFLVTGNSDYLGVLVSMLDKNAAIVISDHNKGKNKIIDSLANTFRSENPNLENIISSILI